MIVKDTNITVHEADSALLYMIFAATQTQTPFISSDRTGGTVDKNHVVFLKCDTKNAQLFYTIDGSAPELHKLNTKVG